MKKFIRDSIEYFGVTEDLPDSIDAFRDIIIDRKILLRDVKPSIKSFVKCVIKPEISDYKIINGASANGENGIRLTGIKCIVNGFINSRVEYIADNSNESLFTDRMKIPFTTNITLEDDYLYSSKLIASVFIEDIYIEKLNSREYLISLALLVIVEM